MKISSCTSQSLARAAAITPVSPRPMRSTSPFDARKQAILQVTHRQRSDRREDVEIDVVVDAHHAVDAAPVVGQRVLVEVLERQFRESTAGRLPNVFALCGQSRRAIAGFAVVGRAKQPLESGEADFAIEQLRGVGPVGLRRRHSDFVQGNQFAHETPAGLGRISSSHKTIWARPGRGECRSVRIGRRGVRFHRARLA